MDDPAARMSGLAAEGYVVAGIPIENHAEPLCSESCKGLCAVCGTNLNKDSCTCKREWQDPRLAALKELRRNDA